MTEPAVLAFEKYEGLANDFVVVDLREGGDRRVLEPEVVRWLCDRRLGIGGDGVLPLLPPTEEGARAGAVARMRVLNADGSEAEMCGNGIRCVAKALHEGGLARDVLPIETAAGVLACAVTLAPDGTVDTVAVEMGRPRLERAEIPMLGAAGRVLDEPFPLEGEPGLRVTAVSMGNPHAMFFPADAETPLLALAERIGPRIETDPRFPRRTNVELVRVLSETTLDLVVWERGCGITMACGTGACATAVAATLLGRAPRGRELEVRLPGGPLGITVAEDLSGVRMRGPARRVFRGTVDLDRAPR